MKKYIFSLLIILVFSLTACTEDIENKITFNKNNYDQIDYIIGSGNLEDYLDVTATNIDGEDLTKDIIFGEVDITSQGSKELTVSVTDADGTKASITLIINVIKINCETNKDHEVCIVKATGASFDDIIPSTMYIGDQYQLNVTVEPSNATTIPLLYSSSNESVATVTNTGRISFLSEGVVEIFITDSISTNLLSVTINVTEKPCSVDPTQTKCFADILSNDSRVTSYDNPNVSGTNYQSLYPKHDLYYEIFVRTFADSNDDNIGDFKGIEENIPYLKSLGVNALWLMPMMDSRSDHGYEIDDYYAVEPDYGTLQEFESLLTEAHNNDISIIIDLVINHMGAQNDIFQDVLRNGINSDYYDWFVWADESDSRVDDKKYDGGPIWYTPKGRDWLTDYSYSIHPSLYDKYYYALFSDWMPDLNLENPEVVDYIYDVSEYWLNLGVDGFRLDATSHFYHNDEYQINNAHTKNVEFLTNFNNHLKTINPNVYVVAEAWEGYQTYGRYYASEISMFDFQSNYEIKDMFTYSPVFPFNDLGNLYNYYDNYDADFINATFLANHDMDRIVHTIGEDNLRMAAEVLLTLPGNPFIYYGDEIGMYGERTNMVWGSYYDQMYKNYYDINDSVSEQLLDPNSLLSTYQELGLIRQDSLALRYGDYHSIDSSGLKGFYRTFENGDDKEALVVLFNFSETIAREIPSYFTEYEIIYASNETDLGGISQRSMMIIRIPYEDYLELTK